jgi:hypothetical protein
MHTHFPVSSTRRRRSRQPASPRPRTRSSNPVPSRDESANFRFPGTYYTAIVACHRLKVLFAIEDELGAGPDAPWADATYKGADGQTSVRELIRARFSRPRQDAKTALLTEDLHRIVRSLPTDLSGVRDKALLLLGFAGAFRRSEMVAITLGDRSLSPPHPNVLGGLPSTPASANSGPGCRHQSAGRDRARLGTRSFSTR